MRKHYQVIGLMSGTSLDGVDLAYCVFTYENENWIYKILNTNTFPYSSAWQQRLRGLMDASGPELVQTDHRYGRYLGELVRDFTGRHNLKPDFVASHGHTIFHEPARDLTLQIGHGAYLSAAAGLPVVCDFRTLDIALGGQGAPLVPIGDRLLFGNYDYCLNLGGISNISFETSQGRIAYDIGACNLLLNTLANQKNLEYDANGELARQGQLDPTLLEKLNAPAFFRAPYPKSLGKEWIDQHSLATLLAAELPLEDKLHTACHHIAWQIGQAVQAAAGKQTGRQLLITGGGALNGFLVELISHYLGAAATAVVPDKQLINFKEALIFAFLGVLRWDQSPNCLQSVTGARHDNIGGAIYVN
ncbi:MAG: anhydro-N-acetylmuramic acid kinase [Adhaeribacter sp.]